MAILAKQVPNVNPAPAPVPKPSAPAPAPVALERFDTRKQVVTDMQTKSFTAVGLIDSTGYKVTSVTRRSNGEVNIYPLSDSELLEMGSIYATLASHAVSIMAELKG